MEAGDPLEVAIWFNCHQRDQHADQHPLQRGGARLFGLLHPATQQATGRGRSGRQSADCGLTRRRRGLPSGDTST